MLSETLSHLCLQKCVLNLYLFLLRKFSLLHYYIKGQCTIINVLEVQGAPERL